MKPQTALRLAVVTAVATLATVGLLGYRLLSHNNQLPGTIPAGLLTSPQLSAAAAQTAVEAIFALSLPDLAGRQQALSQWRGQVLVVNYWATWCPPCVEEMPAFSRLQSHYAAWGVQFVGIGLDEVDNIRTFAANTPVAYPLLVADAAAKAQATQITPAAAPALQVKGMPYTVVIGRDGRIDTTHLGRLDEAALEPILRRLIGP